MLEERAKTIVEGVLGEHRLRGRDEVVDLLDWFDKVRVGLWLLQRGLTGDVLDVDPTYFVGARIRKADRMLRVYRHAEAVPMGLTVVGVAMPLYAFMPSVFGMRIGDYYFLNLSTHYLVSEGGGYPYPAGIAEIREDGRWAE